jgi:site-specific recombinase
VLIMQWLCWHLTGSGAIGTEKALHLLHDNSLMGPSLVFAVLTGVILFTGSLIAGWTENWFIWHRLDSAIAWNPRIISVLGAARAQRWSHWWRQNVSGMAANLSLGMLLGLVPVCLQFFGIPMEVRHVTLVTGQVMVAAGTLGMEVLHDADFWWAIAAIPLIGLANLASSFFLALRVALRARGIHVADRRKLARAVMTAFKQQPGSFLLPPEKQGQ